MTRAAPTVATTGSRPTSAIRARWCFALAWALLGAALIAVGASTLVRWLASGSARFSLGDYSGLDNVWSAEVIAMQVLGMVLVAAIIIALVRESRRAGRLSFRAMVCCSFFLLCWLDPLGNLGYRGLRYNVAWVHVSTWGPYLPGWHSPATSVQIEPLMVGGPGGYAIGMAWFFGTGWVVQLVDSCCPTKLGGLRLAITALAASVIVDAALQLLTLATGWYSFPQTIRAVTLFSGHQWQLPLLNCVFEGTCWAGIPYLVSRLHDTRGPEATFILGGLGHLPRGVRPAVWSLAILGFIGALFLVFFLGYLLLGKLGPAVPLQGPYPFV